MSCSLVSLNPNLGNFPLPSSESVELWFGRKGSVDYCKAKLWQETKAISSRHFRIRYDLSNRAFYLLDESTNGTFVNGVLVGKGKELRLSNKDQIFLLLTGPQDPKYNADLTIGFEFRDERFLAVVGESVGKPLQSSSSSPHSPSSSPSLSSKRSASAPKTKVKLVSGRSGTEIKSLGDVSGQGGSSSRFASKNSPTTPEEFITALKVRATTQLMDKLREAIEEKESTEWLEEFIRLGGIGCVLDILVSRINRVNRQGLSSLDRLIQVNCLKVLKCAMNTQFGLRKVLQTPNALGQIALALDTDNIRAKILVPKLLAAAASISKEGHRAVLFGFDFFKSQKNERVRFSRLIKSLKTEDDLEYKSNVLTLINSLVNSPESVEERVALRKEFLTQGLEQDLQSLRMEQEPDLQTQIDAFLDEMKRDLELVSLNNTDLTDANEIARAISMQVSGSTAAIFLRIMQQLLSIPTDSEEGVECWMFAEKQIEKTVQIGLAASAASDPSVAMANPNDIIGTLRKSAAAKVNSQKPVSSSGRSGPTEVDLLREEVSNLKAQMERKQIEVLQSQSEQIDRQHKEMQQLKRDHEQENFKLAQKLETLQHEYDLLSASTPTPVPVPVIPSPPEEVSGINDAIAAAPPPPPPLGAPVPPPPPFGGFGIKTASTEAAYPFKPSVQMKQLFWKKIPQTLLEKTVWESTDFLKVPLNGSQLESLFGANAKKTRDAEAETEDGQKKPKSPFENILDLKRANNIGIMLSHFKTSPSSIRAALVSMDEEQLTPDKVLQLKKNAPTPEDIEILSQFQGDMQDLGRAEQFLLQMVQVPRVNERLEMLTFKQSFNEKINDLTDTIDAIEAACQQILASGGLCRVLQAILAVGNFLNYAPIKPPTTAFHIEFLPKLASTKSVDNTTTILHFIASLMKDLEPQSYESILQELRLVPIASKASVQTVQTDLNEISNAIKMIKREVQKAPEDAEDKLKLSMLSFSISSGETVDTISSRLQAIQELVRKTVAYVVGTSPDEKTTIDDVFCTLSDFLADLQKAVNDNEREQVMRLHKEKIDKKKEERKQETERRKSLALSRPSKGKGLMDQALGTLRAGTFRHATKQSDVPTEDSLLEEQRNE